MKSYKEIKELLSKRVKTTKYFTNEFYNIFLMDYRTGIESVINGSDQPTWTTVFETDFYNNHSCEYCEFLCVFYESLPHYRIDYFTQGSGCFPVKRSYFDFENEGIARKYMQSAIKGTEFTSVEIMKVA